jgi:hypothetical protein
MNVWKARHREVIERATDESNKRWIEVCNSDLEIREFVNKDWVKSLDAYRHTVAKLEKALEILQ